MGLWSNITDVLTGGASKVTNKVFNTDKKVNDSFFSLGLSDVIGTGKAPSIFDIGRTGFKWTDDKMGTGTANEDIGGLLSLIAVIYASNLAGSAIGGAGAASEGAAAGSEAAVAGSASLGGAGGATSTGMMSGAAGTSGALGAGSIGGAAGTTTTGMMNATPTLYDALLKAGKQVAKREAKKAIMKRYMPDAPEPYYNPRPAYNNQGLLQPQPTQPIQSAVPQQPQYKSNVDFTTNRLDAQKPADESNPEGYVFKPEDYLAQYLINQKEQENRYAFKPQNFLGKYLA